MDKSPNFKEGELVEVSLDKNRRKQLAQHHTITHIVKYPTELKN